LDDNQQVWEQNGLVVTNDKATSTNKVADYANPARFYKGSSLTIKCTLGNITKIEVTCGSNDYATALVNSVGAEAQANEKVVTISPKNVNTSYKVETLTAQVRVAEMTVTYDGEGGTTTPDEPGTEEPETPETPEEPETPEVTGMITCAEAATIAAAENYVGSEDVTVYGYVVELGNAKDDGSKQCFYMSDTKGGEKQFYAYWAFVPQLFEVGDNVTVTGPLKNYKGTIEIVDGQAAFLGETPETPTEPETPDTPEEPEAKVVTVAEFIAAPEATDVYYELTGTIGGTINTTYGNFDLTDETGTVYVYGLTKEFIAVGSTQNDKSYSSLGLKEGDKITIRGFRGSYNDKIEVMGAYFVKLVEAGSGTTPPTPPTPPVGDLVGDGTADNPYTVEDVIALNNTLSGKHYVKAYIVGQAVGQSFVDGLDTEAPFEAAADATQGTNIAIAS
jgi:hypothetical protein